jgi:hypothetical protein
VKTKHQNIPKESLVQKDDHVIIPSKEKLVKMITKNNMKFKERREDTIAHVVQLDSHTQKKNMFAKRNNPPRCSLKNLPKKKL